MDHAKILGWADRQLEALEAAVNAYTALKPYRITSQYEGIAEQGVVRIREGPNALLPDELTFRTGDVLHNMRVSLDYLVSSIVRKHSPQTDESRVAFPICPKAGNFPSVAGMRLKGAPATCVQMIEGFQPEKGWNPEWAHPLLLLDGLENLHKHRRLLATGVALTDFKYVVIAAPSTLIGMAGGQVPSGPLEDGAEVARFTRLDTASAEARVEFRATFHVCFDKAGPARGLILLRTLKQIRDYIRQIIFPSLESFL